MIRFAFVLFIDLEPVLNNTSQRAKVANASGAGQRMIAGADHLSAGRESELVALIADFARR